ncbi:MAG: formylglycine-generating enzyme family protein [Verrucomicrobia bacterium]|nr:formylglycine-generating enzyme family protein [Verrucomicrobiota bacterium]
MKTRLPNFVLISLCFFGDLAVSAQTPASLKIDLPGRLTITGEPGAVYSIEYVTDLSKTNAWRCLDFLQLPSRTHTWVDLSSSNASRRFYRAVRQARPEMIFIPPGAYQMGSPANEVGRAEDEGPQTAVTLSKGFYMAKYKVTQQDYQWVIGTYPSVFTGDVKRPVETVDWQDAANYSAQLTKRERAARVIPQNCVYRLPTEAEWEYACRASTTTRFSYGDDLDYKMLANYAWYEDNSSHTTHAVGEKLPNPWGLYDMHGGLWEWCQDWYGPYPGGSAVDPQGPATGSYRVYRGGSWGCEPPQCRSATRGYNPEGETGYVGFRVVLAIGQP